MNVQNQKLESMMASYAARHGDSALRVETSETPPTLIVFISGALDSETSADLYDFLLVARDQAKTIGALTIDLAGIRYVSSTGIGILSTSMLEYTRNRISFSLRSVPPKIKSLFELLGLWHFFTIAPGGDRGASAK